MWQQIKAYIDHPWAHALLGGLALLALALLAGLIARRVMTGLMRAFARRTKWAWDDAFVNHDVFKRVAKMVPLLIIQFGIKAVPHVPAAWDHGVRRVALALTIVYACLALSAVLNAFESLYQRSRHARMRSIKGYVQLVKIILFVIGAIIIIAALIGRSPVLLLSGLGAISAVLLLIFKDTILSVVASVQIASNDMLRVGDWITMPNFSADGDVIDIALHTVKVQNFDKTITTIPTWRLISDSFQNWRGMKDIGSRRMKRSLNLDLGSVRFLDAEEMQNLRRFSLLDDYLKGKDSELSEWNAKLGDANDVPVNRRRLTNLGTFRAYALDYLQNHPQINGDMAVMVRQLDPGPTGVPLELYCFTATTVWAEYEQIQSDIFDHLIAILPEFGLTVYQQPSGTDLRLALSRPDKALPDSVHEGSEEASGEE